MVQPGRIRVALDAHVVGRRSTGNETYIVSLVDALATDPAVEPIVFVDKGVRWPGSSEPHLHELRSRSPFLRIPMELPIVVRRARADLLHVQYVAPPIAGLPVVTAVHDVSFEDVQGLFGRRTEIRLRMFVRAAVRQSAVVTTLSAFSRDRLIERYGLDPARVFVTPIAVSDRWRPLTVAERASRLDGLVGPGPFVLAVGNLHPRKNFPRLIRAVAAARSGDMDDLQLVIVGQRAWHASEVDAAVDAVKGRGWVTFLGFVDHDVLQALYGHARVVAYVSLYEGLGLPVVEALACGAVVVASSTTAVPEAVGNAGILVDPTREESITDGLIRGAADEGLRSRLSAAGPVWASTFSPDRFAATTIERLQDRDRGRLVGRRFRCVGDRDQHSREAEHALADDSDRDARREEGTEFARADRPEGCLARPASVPGQSEDAVADRPRQPVDERQQRVGIDRKPGVRRGDEDASAGSHELVDEPPLVVGSAHVFDHGVGEAEVEGLVVERQSTTVGLDELHRWKLEAEGGHVHQADRRDLPGVRVAGFEEVVRSPGWIRYPDVEQSVCR